VNGYSGLYYYRARYYDPVLKRFISEDPIGLMGGGNVYGYVWGNPISFTDPSGNGPEDLCKINPLGLFVNLITHTDPYDPQKAAFDERRGPTVFRQGTFADEETGWDGNYVKGKQWATDNPLTTPNYSQKYGLPSENSGNPDWVVKGHLDADYSTRPAPASHNNPANTGGGTEIIPDNPEDVRLDWFHMPD